MTLMARKLLGATLTLAFGLLAGLALGACGSGTKTVTAGSPPPAAASATASTQATAPARTATQTTGGASPAGGTTATTTRSAPEPAFTEHEQSQGATAAAAVVRAHGYTPNDTAEYHPSQTLTVLVGTRSGSGDGYGQQAFFFVNGRYIGTDAREASAAVKVVSQADTEVVLSYPLYRHNDPLCCPGGGQARVRFQLNDGKLVPLDPIPPASSGSALSRY